MGLFVRMGGRIQSQPSGWGCFQLCLILVTLLSQSMSTSQNELADGGALTDQGAENASAFSPTSTCSSQSKVYLYLA